MIKSRIKLAAVWLLLSTINLSTLHAQGSSLNSFTYQGRLNDASGPCQRAL
jgi:hypothetical protein